MPIGVIYDNSEIFVTDIQASKVRKVTLVQSTAPTPTPQPTTVAPTTNTATPISSSPTTTAVPTMVTSTTASPTTTAQQTTTATPTSSTTTATPSLIIATTTPSPTTTSAPTSSPTTVTPATTSPTTSAPSATVTPTTTRAPSPTIIGPTTAPTIVTLKSEVVATVTGNVTLIPQPSGADQAVLFVTDDGKTKSQINVSPPAYTVVKEGIITGATLSLDIVSLGAPVTIEVVAVDENKNIIARVVVQATKAGTLPVDISSLFSNARRLEQVVIGGKAISFTMNVLTPNVPVSISTKTTTVSLSVVTPATQKPTLSSASTIGLAATTIFISTLILV
jgi:hypothetical protein